MSEAIEEWHRTHCEHGEVVGRCALCRAWDVVRRLEARLALAERVIAAASTSGHVADPVLAGLLIKWDKAERGSDG